MRLRKKWWAVPEMAACPYVSFAPDSSKGSWAEVFGNDHPIRLELGCGRMKYLVEMAKRYPRINFIGIDMVPEAMVYGVRRLQESGVENVRVLVMDIRNIEGVFAANEIDRIDIHFCNPWPKLRHQKRRLTHSRQLSLYRSFLKDNGPIIIKTDDDGLYEDTLIYLEESGFEILQTTTDLALADDPDGIISDYEAKWRKAGVPIKRIAARKCTKSAL